MAGLLREKFWKSLKAQHQFRAGATVQNRLGDNNSNYLKWM